MKPNVVCSVCNEAVEDSNAVMTKDGICRCFGCNKAVLFGKGHQFVTSDKSEKIRV